MATVKASAMPRKPAPAAVHAAVRTLPKPVIKGPVRNVLLAPGTTTTVTVHPVLLLGAGLLVLMLLSKK